MPAIDHFEQTLVGPDVNIKPVYFNPTDLPGSHALPSTDAGLDAALQAIQSSGIRAATQAIVLFSTGTDSISNPEGVGRKLAQQGIRVLAIGLRPDPTSSDPTPLERRAALRELALQSKGSYHEVDLRLGRLAIRNHVLNVANRLRFGAPIREAASTSLQGLQGVEIEEGSNGLHLLLCHEPDVDLRISLEGPGGASFATGERDAESIHKGHLVVSIPSPDAGKWDVTVEMPSGGDPGQHVLTAYSDNPNIHIGVSGAQSLYDVGDEIELRAVVGTPMPVVGLTFVARVVSPTGKELDPAPQSKPLPGGAYAVSFAAEAPGAYEVIFDIQNENQAGPAGEAGSDAEIPAFTRSKRFQVHVRE